MDNGLTDLRDLFPRGFLSQQLSNSTGLNDYMQQHHPIASRQSLEGGESVTP